jgi:hypothetical protein
MKKAKFSCQYTGRSTDDRPVIGTGSISQYSIACVINTFQNKVQTYKRTKLLSVRAIVIVIDLLLRTILMESEMSKQILLFVGNQCS